MPWAPDMLSGFVFGSSFRRTPESSSLLFSSSEQGFHSPAASGVLLALPKSRQKARHLTRCPAAHHARRGVPVLLAFAGSLRRHILGNCSLRCSTSGIPAVACAASRSRQSLAATLRAFPAKAAMLGTANGALIHESVHPCTWSTPTTTHRKCDSSLLRQDAAQPGPPEARRGCAGKVRRRAHTMCARSLNVHGRTSSEPRSILADLEGRMPGRRADGGVFLWLSFFAQALRRRSGANSAAGGSAAEDRMPGVKKVTRSPAGRVEALLVQKKPRAGSWITRDSCRGPSGPFAARTFAPASCIRSPALAGMTSESNQSGACRD
jgi:hypothetical protein